MWFLCDIGRILNRFSKDIGFMDDVLIYVFCECLQVFNIIAVYRTTSKYLTLIFGLF